MERQIAVRMADEGIPIRAIARAMKQPIDDVRECLHEAQEEGQIVELPGDDWPAGSRASRKPVFPLGTGIDEIMTRCAREFKATDSEARMLAILLKNGEVTKETLHRAQQARRGADVDIEPKIVDVFICKLRSKLRAHGGGIKVETIWGRGYFIDRESKEKALKILGYEVPAS